MSQLQPLKWKPAREVWLFRKFSQERGLFPKAFLTVFTNHSLAVCNCWQISRFAAVLCLLLRQCRRQFRLHCGKNDGGWQVKKKFFEGNSSFGFIRAETPAFQEMIEMVRWNTLWYREHPIVVPQNLPLAALLYTMWSMSKYVEHVTFRYVHSKAELLTWKKLKHTPQRFLLINHWTMRIQKRFCWCFCWAKPIPRSGWFYHWRSYWPYFRFPTLWWPMKKISFVDGSMFFFKQFFI